MYANNHFVKGIIRKGKFNNHGPGGIKVIMYRSTTGYWACMANMMCKSYKKSLYTFTPCDDQNMYVCQGVDVYDRTDNISYIQNIDIIFDNDSYFTVTQLINNVRVSMTFEKSKYYYKKRKQTIDIDGEIYDLKDVKERVKPLQKVSKK